jgi:hypothetical protein
VGVHLQVLDPSWKEKIGVLGRSSRDLKGGGVVDAIDKAIKDLNREHNDAVDRLRELSVRDRVLVQNRMLTQLQEWKGDISLTLLYQKSGVFQMVSLV